LIQKSMDTTVFGLGFVAILIVIAYIAALILAPSLSGKEKAIFVWYCYDALTHVILEGSFVWISLFGTVASSNHFMAPLWQEYGKADTRWLYSDSCVVSLEILTVVFDGTLCFVILYAMIRNKPYRHFWQIVLCVCELYGGWMTFAPEWITGSKALNTSNPLYLWVYLVIANGVWVIIPLLLIWQSYNAIVLPPKNSFGGKKIK